MNVKLLKMKMVEAGDEDFSKSLASILEVTRQTASAKLNGESELTQSEIARISNHYHFSDEEIRKIFVEGDCKNDSEGNSENAG